jgi:DNA-binding CsgD family transcriptional regulator
MKAYSHPYEFGVGPNSGSSPVSCPISEDGFVDPLELIARTGGAAFATDEQGRIVIWNRAAEQLLHFPASRVLGKPCHDVLCGFDVFGNRYCDNPCALIHMVRRREPVRHFELEIRRESGEALAASFSIVVIPGQKPNQFTAIHFLQPVDRHKDVDTLIRRILAESPAPVVDSSSAKDAPAASPVPLTARELQILRLLADGISTREIADSLFISVTTTRNHVQSVLRKLDVHSKLEAVSLALRRRIL